MDQLATVLLIALLPVAGSISGALLAELWAIPKWLIGAALHTAMGFAIGRVRIEFMPDVRPEVRQRVVETDPPVSTMHAASARRRKVASRAIRGEGDRADAAPVKVLGRILRWPQRDVGIASGEIQELVSSDELDADLGIEALKGAAERDDRVYERVRWRHSDRGVSPRRRALPQSGVVPTVAAPCAEMQEFASNQAFGSSFFRSRSLRAWQMRDLARWQT